MQERAEEEATASDSPNGNQWQRLFNKIRHQVKQKMET